MERKPLRRGQLEKYEQEAENTFSNYYGDEDFDEHAGYDEYYDDDDEDYDEFYDDDDDEDYDEFYDEFENFSGANANANLTGKTGKRYLTFRIKNNNTDTGGTPIAADVTLFGAYGSYTPNVKVPITLDEGDYPSFLSEIAANPHTLVSPRYRVKVASQYANSFEVKRIEASGQTVSHREQPQNYEDPRNNISNLILMDGFGIIADGRTSLNFKMEAGEEISLTFEIASRVNNSLLLTGGSSAQAKRQNRAGGKSSGCDCGKKSPSRGGKKSPSRGGRSANAGRGRTSGRGANRRSR